MQRTRLKRKLVPVFSYISFDAEEMKFLRKHNACALADVNDDRWAPGVMITFCSPSQTPQPTTPHHPQAFR